MKYFISFILIYCFLIACSTSKYSANELPEKQLTFGKGGGFAGVSDEFILLENGQLFLKSSLTDSIEVLPNIKKKKAKELFEAAAKLSMDTLDFNHPGNMYYFVKYREQEEAKNGITWGDMNHAPPAAIKEFYQRLMNLSTQKEEPTK